MGGGGGGPPAGGAGQPDYSAQWAEYYRSIGKVKEAEAIEQQMRAKGGSVPPPGGRSMAVSLSMEGNPREGSSTTELAVSTLQEDYQDSFVRRVSKILIPVLTIELKQASEMNLKLTISFLKIIIFLWFKKLLFCFSL